MKTRVPSSVTVQAKPRMTKPGDAAEREADRLAEAALDPSGGAAPLVATPHTTPVMRQVEPEYEEDDDYDVARQARSSTAPAAPAGFLDTVRSGASGRPLDAGVRGRMERGFGHSFADVRIHADGSSARLSDSIDARAFTHGRDIYFGRGEYSPGTQTGDRLLAHELAHTLQQAPPERIARSEKPRTAEEIRQDAQATLDGWRREFQADPYIDAAKLASIMVALERARRDAAGISDPAQQATRLGYLEAELAMLEDPFYAWVHTRKIAYGGGGTGFIGTVGDPETVFEPRRLARLEAHRDQMRLGTDAYLSFVSLELAVKRQPVEAPEVEGAGPGGVPEGPDTPPPEGEGLDAASIEALRVNRLIGETGPGSEERGPSPVFLQMQSDVAEQRAGAETIRGIASNLDRIKAEVLPDDLKREFAGIDLGFSLFFAETAMIMGLLAGAGERSPDVDNAGKELVKTLQDVSRRIVEELAWMATETALFAAATIATEGALAPAWALRAATLAKRLKAIQQLVSTLTAAYRTTSRITEMVQTVRALREQYPAFLTQYERAMTEFERLQRALESFDAGEEIEAALEQEEERLVEMIDQQLDGQLGAVLEMLYIPEDTPPDELLQILFDIPRGLTALDDMWSFYGDESQRGNEQFGDILAIKAFLAGHYLFPFVGLASSLVAAELQTIFPERSYEDHFNKLITARAGPAGRGKRNRDVFGRLNRKRYTINPNDLVKPTEEARAALEKAIEPREPGSGATEHWVPAWFKHVVREEIKTVNRLFRTRTVPATRPPDKKGGPAPTPEAVPLPPVRVRVSDTKDKVEAEVMINPKAKVVRDKVTANDFIGEGLVFEGPDATREKALTEYMQRWDYGFVKHPKRDEKYVRLSGGKTDTPATPFLVIDGNRLKKGFDPDAYEEFLGEEVHSEDNLPEGYHLYERDVPSASGGSSVNVHVQRKGHVPEDAPQLGLDANRKLERGTGQGVPQKVADIVIKKPETQPYKHAVALAAMFAPPQPGVSPYKQQRSQKKWQELIATEPELRERPLKIEAKLGYTVRARVLGDELKNRHLPGLRESDDKGHILARRFGSPETDPYWNLVPMLRRQNQFPGEWFALESDMAKVYVGKGAEPGDYVQLEVGLDYDGDDTTRRPRRFNVSYQVIKAKGTTKTASRTTKTVENG